MAIRRAAIAAAGTIALSLGLFSATGAPSVSAAAHAPAGSPNGTVTRRAAPNEVTGLAGWGSRAAKALSGRILADQKSLAREGVELTQWGPDAATGKVKVYLTHYSAAARRALITRYGKDIIVAPRSLPRPARDGRQNDTSPFAGGDLITVAEGVCTSGPTVIGNNSGHTFMLMAGHCAEGVGFPIFTDGVEMGTVTNVRLCNDCIDSATVSGTYSDTIWGGSANGSGPLYEEDGSLFAMPGQGSASLVTADGAVTGEVRGVTVIAVNQYVAFNDGFTTRYITEATKSGATVCQPGDSGGPWYQHEGNTGNVEVVGTMVGGSGSTCYYEQIDAITNWFNVHVP